jgi:uncharacterized glyoxalase superfamily protein PhnB
MTIRRIVPDLRGPLSPAVRELYERVLGLRLVMDQRWVVTFAAPENPSAQLTLMTRDETGPVTPDASIELDDVGRAYEVAQEMGCEIVYPLTDEAWGVRRFFVRDCNGNVLNILSHANRRPRAGMPS